MIDIHLSKESPLKSALELMRLWRDVLVDGQSEAREDGSQIRSNDLIRPDSTDDKNQFTIANSANGRKVRTRNPQSRTVG